PPQAYSTINFLEEVEEVREYLALQSPHVPNQAELRCATAGRVRDHRERARRGDGGDVRVAEPQALLLVAAALPRRIDATLLRELRALIISSLLDKLHDLAAPFDAVLRIVRDLEHEEHPREAHDPEADFPCGV